MSGHQVEEDVAAASIQQAKKVIRTDFYKPSRVLIEDITFDVATASIHGFVGHNGAGKSTALKLLIGAATPTQGTVHVFGRPPKLAATRARFGYLPEFPRLPETLSPRELLLAHATFADVPATVRASRCAELLERIGMTDLADARVGTFSKGMQQRVALAVALVADPDLAILDEPMSGLDPAGRRLVRELLLERKERGKTVLLSSHVLPDVEALCDEVTIVHHGRTVATGTLSELVQGPRATEVVFVTDSDDALAHARALGEVQTEGDTYKLLLPDAAGDPLDHALVLRDKGAQVRRLQQAGAHLEDELLRLLGDRPADPRREAA
jgi:ABC-2 type transport system ATP-binding protein